ncbi:MAG: hypothetical protein ACTSVY_01225 [Candidatus Helarchaeota archaeon]
MESRTILRNVSVPIPQLYEKLIVDAIKKMEEFPIIKSELIRIAIREMIERDSKKLEKLNYSNH